MTKEEIINEINTIIEEYGSFNTGDIEAECDIAFENDLLSSFDINYCQNEDSNRFYYSNINNIYLLEVLDYCERFKEQNELKIKETLQDDLYTITENLTNNQIKEILEYSKKYLKECEQ
jgi:hypothetical protein